MRKWLKRIAALFAALAALWAGLAVRRHDRREVAAVKRVNALEADRTASVAEAEIARDEAQSEALAAEAALAKGRARIKRVREKSDATFADRLDDLNRRLRGE
jgi:predicted  nucleic acid-binding Zn-ribbon protein